MFTIVINDLFTFVNMRNEFLNSVLSDYPALQNKTFFGRYITYAHIEPELERLQKFFSIEEVGQSVLNVPIHSISVGKGPIKVLGWSQMHGNESTTTKAVFDLLNLFKKEEEYPEISELLETCTIKFIPMLNPDGAQRYTRENVNSVDLNRDAFELKEVESKVLRKCFEDFSPDFCLNLHDQRTIFSAGETDNPATLSFLAPSMDAERSINENRRKAMQIIGSINQSLQSYLPNRIGRYDDAFNINCTGDTFQALGVPTILFEAGHYPDDYMREQTRKYMALAILGALLSVSKENYKEIDIRSYLEIPENKKNFFDIILRKAKIGGEIVDVAIQYQEKITAGGVTFDPVVQIIATSISFYGHEIIDCANNLVTHLDGRELIENDLVGSILLNRSVISIKKE